MYCAIDVDGLLFSVFVTDRKCVRHKLIQAQSGKELLPWKPFFFCNLVTMNKAKQKVE